MNCYFCCQYLSDESYTRTCEVFTEELTNRGELGDVQLHSSNGVDGVCYPGTTLHWTVLHTNAHTHTHTHTHDSRMMRTSSSRVSVCVLCVLVCYVYFIG